MTDLGKAKLLYSRDPTSKDITHHCGLVMCVCGVCCVLIRGEKSLQRLEKCQVYFLGKREGGRNEERKWGCTWHLCRNDSIGGDGGEIFVALIEELELSCITLGERGTDCGGWRHTQLCCHESVAGAAGQLGVLHCTECCWSCWSARVLHCTDMLLELLVRLHCTDETETAALRQTAIEWSIQYSVQLTSKSIQYYILGGVCEGWSLDLLSNKAVNIVRFHRTGLPT